MEISEKFRLNEEGKKKGFGHCNICGDRWNWKQPYTIYIGEGKGAFPFCKECERNATKKEKFDAGMQLVHDWLSQTSPIYLQKTNNFTATLVDCIGLCCAVNQLYRVESMEKCKFCL